MRRNVPDESQESQFTWRTPGPLAGRLEVPVAGAWERLYASGKRRMLLEQQFSSQLVTQGGVVGLAGPAMTSKSQDALAVCDLRGLRAVYATEQTDQQAYTPTGGICVIIDPVSAYDPRNVAACVQFYAGRCPVILVDRDPERIETIPGVTLVLRLKLPSADAIAHYLHELMDGAADDPDAYRYPHELTLEDFQQIGQAMKGMSLPQVNQVALDASLGRLQHDQPVDRRAFDQALSSFSAIRNTHPAGVS